MNRIDKINYYLDISDDTYKPCHKNCATCSKEGDDENNNCDSCITDYFFISTKEKQCIYKDKKPANFYLDGDTFKECYQTCSSCEEGYSKELKSHNCLKCKDSYWFEREDSSNCINIIKDGLVLKTVRQGYPRPSIQVR